MSQEAMLAALMRRAAVVGYTQDVNDADPGEAAEFRARIELDCARDPRVFEAMRQRIDAALRAKGYDPSSFTYEGNPQGGHGPGLTVRVANIDPAVITDPARHAQVLKELSGIVTDAMGRQQPIKTINEHLPYTPEASARTQAEIDAQLEQNPGECRNVVDAGEVTPRAVQTAARTDRGAGEPVRS